MAMENTQPELVIPTDSVAEYVTQYFGSYGDRIAMIDNASGEQLSYSILGEQIRSVTAAMRKSGIKKGDMVGLSSRNCVQYPVVLLASLACGAVLTTLSPSNSKNEMLHRLGISQPSIIFVDEDASATEVYVIGHDFGVGNMKPLRTQGQSDDDPASIKLDQERDLAFIFYSSGTTGLPKAIALSHKNMVSRIHIFSNHFKLVLGDCCYTDRSMSHSYGDLLMLQCLQAGATLVFETNPDVEQVVTTIEKYQVTHVLTAPPLVIGLAQETSNKNSTTSLRYILSSGSSVPQSVIITIEERYKLFVSSVYGLTECGALAMPDPAHYSVASVGTALTNCDIKIVDVDTGLVVPSGKVGEILVKAPQVALGYYRNAKATEESFEDGWFLTGDLGYFDEKEMLYVVGRLKEMIKYNGMQVPPAEVEAVLLTHSGIAGAAVIGIPDAKVGEVPKAFVVRKDDQLSAEDVKRYVEGNLADWKHLRGGVEFIPSIPINKNGKIDRLELKSRHEFQM